MQTIELIKDDTGELARQSLDEGYQAVALELGKSYEALQRENARLRKALETYPEWFNEQSEDGEFTGWQFCLACRAVGLPSSTRSPLVHALDCARQLALAPEPVDTE